MNQILKQVAKYSFAAVIAAGVLDAGEGLAAQFLVNVDFGAGPGPSAKVGLAATGLTTNDFWNFYTRDNGQGGWRTYGALTNLKEAGGLATEVGLIVVNAPGARGNGSSDPMYHDYIYPLDSSDATVTLTNLPAGRYDLYVYGSDGNYRLTVGDTDLGTQRSHEDPVANPPQWKQGVQYALFQNLEVTQAGEPVVLTVVQPGIAGPAILSGLQITQATLGAGVPPSILTQPTGLTVDIGGTATFSVVVSGTPPLACQWSLNGKDIPGATNGVLTVVDAQAADAGAYRVVVTSPYGSATSSDGVLTVLPSSPPPGESFLVDVDFGAGAGPSAKAGLAATGQTTNDFWNFYTRDDGQGNWRTFGALTNLSQADGTPTGVGLTVANAPGAWGNGSSDPMYHDYIYPFDGGDVTVTVSNLPAGQYDIYVYGSDGNYEVTSGGVDEGIQTTHDYPVTNPPHWKQGVQYALFQEVKVTQADQPVLLTVRPGVGGYAVISGLQISQSVPAPPSVQTQPESLTVLEGSTASFNLKTSGTEPLSYQWFKGNTVLEGQTDATLLLTNVQLADEGLYWASVSNALGSVVSSNAMLTVLASEPPLGGSFFIDVDFGAGAGPSAKAGLAATGQTTNDFWNFYTRDDGQGNWRTLGALTNLSQVDGTPTGVGLTVANAPGAWGNGSSDPMYHDYIYPFDGGDVTVTVTNLPAGQYDIYVYGSDGNYEVTSGGVVYGPQTTYEYPVVNPPDWRMGVQYALFRNVTVATGQPFVLTVKPGTGHYAIISGLQIAPSSKPLLVNVDFGVNSGPSAKVGLAAAGQTTNDFWNFFSRDDGQGGWRTFGALTNLKQADGTLTGVGLTVANAPGAWGNGSIDPMYYAYIYPLNGGNATVTLTNLPPGHYDLYVYGNDGNYQAAVGGTNLGTRRTYEYPVVNPPHWQEGVQYAVFQNLEVTKAGETVVLTVQPGSSGYAVISGLQIAQTSPPANSAPFILTQPASRTLNVGGSATFSVAAGGTRPLNFQWFKGSTVLEGQDNESLVVSNAQLADAGVYWVSVSNAFGSVASSNAELIVTSEPPPGGAFLLDVDFGAGTGPSAKTGMAATGQATNDFWNFYTRDDGHGNWRTFGALTNLKRADGTPTSVGLTVSNAPGAWGNGSSDPMYDPYVYPLNGENATVTLTNLPAGLFNLYVYGSDGNYQASVGGTDLGTQRTHEDPVGNPPQWKPGVQYALFPDIKVTQAGEPVVLTIVQPGIGGPAIISGLQIAGELSMPAAKLSVVLGSSRLLMRTTDKGMSLQFSGMAMAGRPVVLYASTNLLDWTAISTNAATRGALEYFDSFKTNLPQRFYRLGEVR